MSNPSEYAHDQERSQKWIFTTNYRPGIYHTPHVIIYVGPTEVTNGVPHNHGMYVTTDQNNQPDEKKQ